MVMSKKRFLYVNDYANKRISRCLLPIMQDYFESDEGQRELQERNAEE